MSDFHTLTDAFTELERQADAASISTADPTASRHRSRAPLVAASVVAVLAVATGGALLARNGGSDSPAAAPPAASQPAAAQPPATTPAAFQIPTTPAQLAARFQAVLGGTATFTVIDTGSAKGPRRTPAPNEPTVPTLQPIGAKANGAAIVGLLTASGVTGGYDLQIFRTGRGDAASCDDPDRSTCSVRRLADGSSLAVGSEPLQQSPDGVTYQVTLIRPDGVEFLMHLSNERDPKGESAVLAAHPPLTTEQMTAIVTSEHW